MVFYRDLGTIRYEEALNLQKTLFQEVIDRKTNNKKLPPEQQLPPLHHLLFCEHLPVYTLGRNGKMENLLLNTEALQSQGIDFVHIGRGGDITFHGQGQLVGYPILDLDDVFCDVGRYVRCLEEMTIRTLAEYGIKSGRIAGLSGVWLDEETPQARKICAVGVHLSRWVTMHGFAFNINTDLRYFQGIVPCGITDKAVTSLQQELGRAIPMQEVKTKMLRHFQDVFELTIAQ